ncbi:RabGAP/TBC [Metschnikowia bicuspidata var. bicuspidata NRRL YB-4993]|uniref:RabGAP/TBC n=1 Tax=Metschnikowia bicuspidata var. bicuspidata NRRL YB-4993 TaxID=869754 RepID=A0A1A0HF28_9ASCO|nr:RabGAP/TBC [Metschnikowia bicuspidata var. bicuspidata NRRL YB-4993]OBA22585.1 RabGAP/TBC [Metschnikowia bicuspidata var. bicuspidata NRRL YB-4993]
MGPATPEPGASPAQASSRWEHESDADDSSESEFKDSAEAFGLPEIKQETANKVTALPSATVEALSLLEARQLEISIRFDAKDEGQRRAISTGVESVRKTYRDIRSAIGHLPVELLRGEHVDWGLWDRVVEDYHDTVLHEQQQLARAVAGGIPEEVRGIVWQLVARSKSLPLEELFMHLKTEPCVHERAIKRDLTRTSFFAAVEAAGKARELYDVVLAYANFDPDVGYTQGMVFIAVPLVMNMAGSEAFCLLVSLMKDYGLRELFCPEMRGLHLLLHQFDRLLAVHRPLLYNHLLRQGVRLSMYASQWFLTFFSYKFPLPVVLRVFDMVITQGMEAVLRLALNLMLQNEPFLLPLPFDRLLDFLKDRLFNVYAGDGREPADDAPVNRRFLILARRPAARSLPPYDLDAFIRDSMQIDVSPLDLARWKAEFDLLLSQDSRRAADINTLRAQNGCLRHEVKAVEIQTHALRHDHLASVQSLVDVKIALPELQGDVDELASQVASLEASIHRMELRVGAGHADIPQDIDARIQELLAQNAQETERLSSLEDQLGELCLQEEALAAELKKSKKWFWKH